MSIPIIKLYNKLCLGKANKDNNKALTKTQRESQDKLIAKVRELKTKKNKENAALNDDQTEGKSLIETLKMNKRKESLAQNASLTRPASQWKKVRNLNSNELRKGNTNNANKNLSVIEEKSSPPQKKIGSASKWQNIVAKANPQTKSTTLQNKWQNIAKAMKEANEVKKDNTKLVEFLGN